MTRAARLAQFEIDYKSEANRVAGENLLRDIGYDLGQLSAPEATVVRVEAMRVEQLVRRYQAMGVDGELLRPFMHLAAFEKRDNARLMSKKLKIAGYSDITIERKDVEQKKSMYFLAFGHIGPLKLIDLAGRVVRLGRDCFLCAGQYDGWQFSTTRFEASQMSSALQLDDDGAIH